MVNGDKKYLLRNARAIVLPFALLSFIACPVRADVKVLQDHAFPKTKIRTQTPVSQDKPVLMTADEVHYDQPNNIVVANGHVEISQGDTVILADTVSYDREKNEVQAEGNISMMGPSGEVYFADRLSFQDNLKSGVIHEFKARLPDDSVAVASEGQRVNENITELFKAAYTPCKCTTEEGEGKTPLWSLKADHMTVDQTEKKASYENATFNVYDVPILYTPYFSHPLPGADNQSGLLTPEFMESHNLGTVYKQPVYYSISADKDITFTPILTSQAGQIMATDYRQMFDSGVMELGGSVTNAPNRDSQGNPVAGNETRGHIDAKGKFDITDTTDWGFNVRRASDDTYLHLYNFSNDTVLTSRVYAEGFNFGDNDRSYASAEGLSFQGLTGKDNDKLIPIVAPLMNFTWEDDPGVYDSRLGFDANSMVLYRVKGADSRRLSGTARWGLPYITDDGQMIELNTQMRTDIYDVDNVLLSNGQRFNGVTGRAVPQLSANWRYPFLNRFDEESSLMIEPIANFTVSPGGGNPEKIPNEDSLLPDFTDANLFSSNRFAGLDRIENGPRMSYGLRGQAQVYSDKYIDWLLGQQYRVINDPNFPISNNLTSHFSDYVGKVGLTYHPLSLAYRFRVDKNNIEPHRSEIDAGYNEYPFALNASYLSLTNDPVLANREVVTGTGSVNLTREWSVNLSGSRDILLDQTVTTYTGLTYKNECVNVTTMVGKDYTNVLDIEPSLTFWLRVSLKNLD